MRVDDLIGNLPNGSAFEQRMRYHQGWWRASVLDLPAGAHPQLATETVCNTIAGGRDSGLNFVDGATATVVTGELERRASEGKAAAGLMLEGRLFDNLLSSQPLAFNFFGRLALDLQLARRVMSQFVPMDSVEAVRFEFAGPQTVGPGGESENARPDNSAFDVAVLFTRGARKGLIGIECKYVDSLTSKQFDKPAYRQLLERRRTFAPHAEYETLILPRFNQLFRNQLIAERLLQLAEYDIAETLVFCHPADNVALATTKQFESWIVKGPNSGFGTVTYAQFIAAAQRLELPWELREWTMKLWARYCAETLSARSFSSRNQTFPPGSSAGS